MYSSDASWKASLEDPTFSLVLCSEEGCTRAVIGRADKEFRCGNHENQFQAFLEANIPAEGIWYE